VAALLARVEGLRSAAVPAGYVAIPQELHDAACRLASDVPRLQREVDDLTREVRGLDEAATIARDEARDDRAARDAAETALRNVWRVVAPDAEGFPRVAQGDDEVADAARIAAAVERRVAAARREGAEAMREVALRVARAEAARCDYGADSPYAGRPDERDAALRVAEELRVCAGPRWEP
jgi:hypothetical protein